MRKKILGFTAAAFVLTMSTGITAFAGSWKEDAIGRYYENDDGSRPVYAGWFTDPADGAVYAMDPDGYTMPNSNMGSFRTDDMGRRIDKTEEDLKRENERKAELAKRPSPAKKQAAADIAADAATAGTSRAATGTLRSTFQAEMEAFMNKILLQVQDKRTETTIRTAGTENNTEITYGFQNPDGYVFITSSIWKTSKSTAANYKEQAFEMSYHFDSAVADIEAYNEAYNQLMVAALGETTGPAVLDYIQTERNSGHTSFDKTGATDSGNTYTVKYRDGLVSLAIVCSEVDPTASSAQEQAAEEAAQEAPQEQAPASSVILAGTPKEENAQ